MPYRQNFPIPTVIDPPKQCLCIEIPNHPDWKRVIAGTLGELRYWYNWERTGGTEGAQCAAVWKQVFDSIDWSDMSCCCDQTIFFQWTVDGDLQQSTDGGVTWVDVPQKDPRNNSTVYPPMSGDDGPDKRCLAATSGAELIKAQVGDQLTDDMSRFTLGELISTWVNTIIQSSNPFEALINIAVNQIFSLVISAVRAALTDTVYDTLKCIFYCSMADDASFDSASWAEVRDQIGTLIGGVAGLFLEHLVYLLGPVGLTNIARSGFATEGDCDACECPADCGSFWDVMDGSHGVIIARGDNTIDVEAQAVGGNYYLIVSTSDADQCCVIVSAEVLSGSTPSLTGWTDCGTTPVIGVPQHTGLFGFNSYCVNYFQQQDAGPFTVRLTFVDCP